MSAAEERRRNARVFAVVNSLLLLALLAQVNYLSYRHYERWDWTEHSLFTLSEQTLEVLEDLDTDVDLWIFVSEGENGFGELQNLFARYRAESPHITLHYVSPDSDPGAFREAAHRFGFGTLAMPDSQISAVAAVVEAGDRHWEVARTDLLSRQMGGAEDEGTMRVNVEGERVITGALVELIQGEPTQVCLTEGHGEFSLDGGARSLSGFADEMRRRQSFSFTTIETRGNSEIPERCDLVGVVGPMLAFDEREAQALSDYLRGGGNLLVAVDPILNDQQTDFQRLGLESLLAEHGIRVERSVVMETHPAFLPSRGRPIGPFAVLGWGEHDITGPFRSRTLPVVVQGARPVRPTDEERVSVLFQTSAVEGEERTSFSRSLRGLTESFADTEHADDVPGPIPLAVATRVEVLDGAASHEEDEDHAHELELDEEDTGGRLVVIGTSSMFMPEQLADPTFANHNFVAAVVGWLGARGAMIALEARSVEHTPVFISGDDVNNLFFRVVLLIPLAFIFLGFAVWWNRRS